MKKAKWLLVIIAVACFFIVAYLGGSALLAIRPNPSSFVTASAAVQPKPTFAPLTGGMDITTASLDTLDTLPGIGPATAEAVHAYLQSGGTFYFPEDIQNVKGIGPKKWQEILPFLSFSLPPFPTPNPLFP